MMIRTNALRIGQDLTISSPNSIVYVYIGVCNPFLDQEPNKKDVEIYLEELIKIQSLLQGKSSMIPGPTYSKMHTMCDAEDAIYQSTRVTIEQESTEEVSTRLRNKVNLLHENRHFDLYEKLVFTWELLDTCYASEISESALVVQILRILKKTGGELFDKSSYQVVFLSSFLFVELQQRNPENKSNYISYLLGHARNERETFGGSWFTDNSHGPVFVCIRQGNAILLTEMLRYGFCSTLGSSNGTFTGKPATFKDLCGVYNGHLESWCNRFDVSNSSKAVAILGLTLVFIFGQPNYEKEKAFLFHNTPDDLNKVCESLRIFFRAISVPFCRIPRGARYRKDGSFGELKYTEQAPCSLKHLSKCAIRQRLGENWKLPDGIFKLGLPEFLCKYLNLEND